MTPFTPCVQLPLGLAVVHVMLLNIDGSFLPQKGNNCNKIIHSFDFVENVWKINHLFISDLSDCLPCCAEHEGLAEGKGYASPMLHRYFYEKRKADIFVPEENFFNILYLYEKCGSSALKCVS